jgi:hypothetical protein
MNRLNTPANPFTYGNPVNDPTAFIGRNREVKRILDILHKGGNVSLIGDFRMGKSSMLYMLANPIFIQRSDDKEYFLPIYFSLDVMDKSATPIQFWQLILKGLRQQTKDASTIAKIDGLLTEQVFAFSSVIDFFKSQGLPIVLLLDEFETIAESPNFDKIFEGHLRYLINSDIALRVVTSSRVPLYEMYTNRPLPSGSPLFNAFMNVYLPLFSLEDARQLISYTLQTSPFGFRESEISYIFQISGGHPYLLKVASHFLFQAYLDGLDRNARKEYLNKKFYQESIPHYSYIWKYTNDRQKIGLTALALLSKKGQESKYSKSSQKLHEYLDGALRIMAELENRGLITDQNDEFQLFSSTFVSWIFSEIKTTISEPQEYETWLKDREAQTGIAKLSKRLVDEVKTEILPQIATNYRNLILTWLSDPKTITSVVTLLRSTVR